MMAWWPSVATGKAHVVHILLACLPSAQGWTP